MTTIFKDYGAGGSGLNPGAGISGGNGNQRHPALSKVLREMVTDMAAMRTALIGSGLMQHTSVTAPITSPDASGAGAPLTAAQVLLANEIRTKWAAHVASVAASSGAHKAADVTNVIAAAAATDEASAITLANEIKVDFNGHNPDATYHYVGGAGGFAVPADVATADASNTATLTTLLNALKAAINLHFANGMAPMTVVAG